MQTRGQKRRANSSYRRHRRSSHCHKKARSTCKNTSGCKYTNGKRQYCRKSRNTHSRSFRNKQRGGSTLEALPSSRNAPIGFNASKYNSMSGSKVGGRRHKRRHSKRRHSKRRHSRRHHSKRRHSRRRHSRRRHSRRRHSRRRRGGNPAFVTPAVLLAAQKLVQQNGLGL